jgi:aryl-alcohol dehydrogenase-like predicted oxidoreductase
VAIAWVLAHPAITSSIIGASRPEQLKDSLAGATLALDASLKAKLDQLTAEYRYGDAIR